MLQKSMSILFATAVSYLLGSIPFGFILVRIFRGQDVRKTGSGNIAGPAEWASEDAIKLIAAALQK